MPPVGLLRLPRHAPCAPSPRSMRSRRIRDGKSPHPCVRLHRGRSAIRCRSRNRSPRRDAHHVGRLVVQVRRSPLHELAALLQKVGAGIGGFGLVRDNVRTRRLHDRVRCTGALARPIPEARPRADVSLQLADTKQTISFGPKPSLTNLPTWTDWRSVGESELARGSGA